MIELNNITYEELKEILKDVFETGFEYGRMSEPTMDCEFGWGLVEHILDAVAERQQANREEE